MLEDRFLRSVRLCLRAVRPKSPVTVLPSVTFTLTVQSNFVHISLMPTSSFATVRVRWKHRVIPGFCGQVDFVFVLVHFKRCASYGIAFVNFPNADRGL